MAKNEGSTLYNALTAGSKVTGTIQTEGDIRIDGTLEGDLQCAGKAVIGKSGYIKGNITCQNIEILGKVHGQITAQERLTLRTSSEVQGEISINVIEVEAGAKFEGSCKMI